MDPATRDAPAMPPATWREAVLTLVASRVALIELEAKEAASRAVKRLLMMALCAVCLVFTWALLLAGVIAAIAGVSGRPWYWFALAAALAHLAAAIGFARSAAAGNRAAFAVTRAEFAKDRQWIESLQHPPQSGS